MNICLLCRNFFRNRGGIPAFTAMMANALARLGHTVHVVGEENPNNYHTDELEPGVLLHPVSVEHELFRGAWRCEGLFPVRALAYAKVVRWTLEKIQRGQKIDAVEATAGGLETYFPVRNGDVRVFLRFHGGDHIVAWHAGTLSLSGRERVSRMLQRRELVRAKGLIAISASVADYARQFWRLGQRPITVIHNGVELSGLTDQAFTKRRQVLFAGWLHPNKGILVLAEAIREIERGGVLADYVIAGSEQYAASEYTETKRYFESMGFKSNIQFTGSLSRPELFTRYAESAIFVMPSCYEPFGLVAIESMAHGCAVIATKSGGPAEFIQDGVDGLLVPPDDPVALAKAMRTLLEDNGLTINMGTAGREKVLKSFDITQCAEKTVEIYASMAR